MNNRIDHIILKWTKKHTSLGFYSYAIFRFVNWKYIIKHHTLISYSIRPFLIWKYTRIK